MGQNVEEILVRLGLNADSLNAGTRTVTAQQKAAAAEYTGFWNKALAEREAAEKALTAAVLEENEARTAAELNTARAMAATSRAVEKATAEYVGFWNSALAEREAAEITENDRSLARLAKRVEAEKAAAAMFFEEQAAQASIARGSVPENMAGGSRWAKGAEEAAIGGAAGALAHRGATTSIFREMQVLLHEGIAGRWKQFVSSFSRLLMFMGLTAETLLSGIPIIGTGIAGIWGNLSMRKSLEEQAGGYGTVEGTKGTEEIIGKRLRAEIAKLVAAGKLSSDQGRSMAEATGSMAGISSVQRDLAQFLPQGFATDLPTLKEQMKAADELAEREQRALDDLLGKKRSEADLTEGIREKQNRILELNKEMAAYNANSLAWHQKEAELLGVKLALQKDLNQQADEQREKDRQAKEQEESTKQWQEWSDRAARDYMRQKIHEGEEAAVFPTMENLAGRTWYRRFSAQYGRGGRFDLGRGDGPFAALAREYTRAKFQQEWDRTYAMDGDSFNQSTLSWEHFDRGAAIENDRLRMINARDQLIRAGAASPEMLLTKIADKTTELRDLFFAMQSSGALRVDVTGTD